MRLMRLFRRSPWHGPAIQLYEAAVTQARQPRFYAQWQVPDTVDGRFDSIAVHVFLILFRLKDQGPDAEALGQELFDVMFADMDRSLREMGVGDLGVKPKIKRMASAFMGRVGAYNQALDHEDDAALAAALRRNLFRKSTAGDAELAAMVAYVRAQAADLARQPLADLLAGRVAFQPPEPGDSP